MQLGLSETPPSVGTIAVALGGMGGMGALGAVAALGSADLHSSAQTVPAAVLIDAGALVLTAPALVVLHQYLGLRASPASLVSALGRAFVLAGHVALALVPAQLFFSATSNLGLLLFGTFLATVGLWGLKAAGFWLLAAEKDAQETLTNPDRLRMEVLALGWAVLAALTGARIAYGIAAAGVA
jgi:hypothetical protein